MAAKRVFILGAGFSKQAGLPLATELTSLILEGTTLKELDEMQSWFADFSQRVAAVEGACDGPASFMPSVEQLFDFAAYDEELWRMSQQLCPVGRHMGTTPWDRAESIRTWMGYVREELAHVIWDAQRNADLCPIERFTSCLALEDTIVSFNYDTLIESALSAMGRPWNHGLNDKGNGGVTVLKMHGSADWILLPRRPEQELRNFVKLFSKNDSGVERFGHKPPREEPEYALELWQARDTKACNGVMEEHQTFGNSMLGLAWLGRDKILHQLPGSAATWFAAFEALQNADEVFVVGFSMSQYDTMTRFHFASAMRQRENPPMRVTVVDRNAQRLEERMRVVFGQRPEVIGRTAESVNWQEILR